MHHLGLLLLCTALLAGAGSAAQALDGGADGDFDRRDSSHFVLFQDVDIDRKGGWGGSVAFEREVLKILEAGHDRLGGLLGLRPRRKIQVWVYDPIDFDRRFAGRFRFRIAGFFGDAIHVRGDSRVTASLSRTLHHELLHAAMAAEAPSLGLPAWFGEGLAEWFESRTHGKRRLSPGEWAALEGLERGGSWVPVTSWPRRSFLGIGADAVSWAYLESYALVDFLARRGGEASLERLVAASIRSRSLDRALGQIYKLRPGQLEQALRVELR